MRKLGRRVVSAVLAVSMMMSVCPAGAFASGPEAGDGAVQAAEDEIAVMEAQPEKIALVSDSEGVKITKSGEYDLTSSGEFRDTQIMFEAGATLNLEHDLTISATTDGKGPYNHKSFFDFEGTGATYTINGNGCTIIYNAVDKEQQFMKLDALADSGSTVVICNAELILKRNAGHTAPAVSVPNGVTLELDHCTISQESDCVIENNGGEIILNDCTVQSNETAICALGGTTIISGGKVEGGEYSVEAAGLTNPQVKLSGEIVFANSRADICLKNGNTVTANNGFTGKVVVEAEEPSTGLNIAKVAREEQKDSFAYFDSSYKVCCRDDKSTLYIVSRQHNVGADEDKIDSITAKDENGDSRPDDKIQEGDTVTIRPKPAPEGEEIKEVTVKTDPSGKDVEVKSNGDGSYDFTMPDEDVTIDVIYQGKEYTLTIVEDTVSRNETVRKGTEYELKAANTPAGKKLTGWQSDRDDVTITDGKFTMPIGPLTVTAQYRDLDQSINATEKDENITIKDENGSEITPDMEIPVGKKVYIKAKTLPGMKFVGWDITPEVQLDKPNDDPDNSFDMPQLAPGEELKIKAQYEPDTSGSDDGDPGSGGTSGGASGGDGGAGAGLAIAAVAGAALIGGTAYFVGTQYYLSGLLPPGTAIPTSRQELADLLWTTAGKPEPKTNVLLPDISAGAVEKQKAALWCVEQGLMSYNGVTFSPDGYVFRPQVIKAWNDLQEKLELQRKLAEMQ